MTRRQYQFIALTLLVCSLLLVNAAARALSAYLPGEPVGTAPPPAPPAVVPASDALAGLPAPLPPPPAPPPQQMTGASGSLASTEPSLDTSGLAIAGTDAMTMGTDPSGQAQAEAPAANAEPTQPVN